MKKILLLAMAIIAVASCCKSPECGISPQRASYLRRIAEQTVLGK